MSIALRKMRTGFVATQLVGCCGYDWNLDL